MKLIFATSFFLALPLFSQPYATPAKVFSNRFGGNSGSDAAVDLAVDPSGNVAVIGTTGSPDFPVTKAYQPQVANPPLVAVSQNGWTYPNLGAAVDVTALTSTVDGSVVYAASSSGIFRSADGGVTWTQQLPGLAGAVAIAVDGADPNTVYAGLPIFLNSGNYGGLKSTDGGHNWVKLNINPYLAFDQGVVLRCPAQIAGTIYTTAAGFHRSRDGGNTWVDIGPHQYNVFSFALAPSDPNVVYTAASDGFVYRSSNGGDTWTAPGAQFAAFPSANSNLYVYAMGVDPRNENTVWALEATGNLYRSTDGGATFSVVLSDPADQSLAISIGPSGSNMIVSGGRNPVVSYDSGASWQRVNLPGSRVVLAEQNSFLMGSAVGIQGFLTKWSADGTRMIFSTFLPTPPSAVAADAFGNTYVAGQSLMKFDATGDVTFNRSLAPLSASAIAVDSAGNVYLAATNAFTTTDCGAAQSPAPIIFKFDPQGNQLFANPVPQTCGSVYSMTLDNAGAIYLAGYTFSKNLATTPTAIEPTLPYASETTTGFLAVLTPQADRVTYLTYVAMEAYSVAVDNLGGVYAAGSATNLPLTATNTFTGGSCGTSGTENFAFVIKLSLSSSTPAWLDRIGGCFQNTAPTRVAIDATGNVWVGGQTQSSLYPLVAPFDLEGTDESFLSEISADGSKLLFSSYAPPFFALGPQQTVYLAGASSPNPPKADTQTGTLSTYALVTKLDASKVQSAIIDSITGVAQPAEDGLPRLLGIAPGEMIRISGRGLGPVGTLVAKLDSNGRVATSLGGIQVLFNGIAAPLISVNASSIVCMTPFEVSGLPNVIVQVFENGIGSRGVVVGVKEVAFAPDILAVANPNGTLNSQSNPAHSGDTVSVYLSGMGNTVPFVPDGSIYQTPVPAPLYPAFTYGYAYVTQTYSGPAPGQVAGIWQINLSFGPQINPGASQILLGSTYGANTTTQVTPVAVWFGK